MDSDEQAIRSLVTNWMQASARGDLASVLTLMADDVVFLGPGRPPMEGKDAFAAASRAMDGKVAVEGTAETREVRVFGDWAYSWNHLTVTMRPTDGSASSRLTGPVLSILRKTAGGRWVLFRDANMIAPDRPQK